MHREVQSHTAEPFWYIHVAYRATQQQQQQQGSMPAAGATGGGKAGERCEFSWVRGRLFDQDIARLLFQVQCRVWRLAGVD